MDVDGLDKTSSTFTLKQKAVMKFVSACFAGLLLFTSITSPQPSSASANRSYHPVVSKVTLTGPPTQTAVVAKTYYVSSSYGDDANPGTSKALPFATLDRAFRAASTSDAVLLRRGDVWEPHAHPNYSVNLHGVRGTASARFVIGAYGPEEDGRPQIEGGISSSTLTWTRVGGDVWYAPALTDDAGLVWYDGDGAGGDHGVPFARVTRRGRLDAYAGTAYYDAGAGRAYIHLPDSLSGREPAVLPLRIAGANAAFLLDGVHDYVTLRDVKVSHTKTGIHLDYGNTDFPRVENVHVAGCGYYGLIAANTDGLEVVGGIYEGCHNGDGGGGGSGGIHVISPRETDALVEGVLVRDNGSLEVNRLIGPTNYAINWAGGIEIGRGTVATVRDNTCLAREGTMGAVCYNVESSSGGSVVFHSNVAVGGRWGAYVTGTSDVTFDHNTFVGWGGDALDAIGLVQSAGIALNVDVSDITIRNNILASDYSGAYEAAPIAVGQYPPAGLVAHHNLLWLSTHRERAESHGFPPSVRYRTLDEWQAEGYGAGSEIGAPLLIGVDGGDYALGLGSPAIGLAISTPYTPPYDGPAPDAGAVQTSMSRDVTPPAAPSDLAVTDVTGRSVVLSWTDGVDDSGYAYAVVYVDGAAADSFATSPYAFTGLNGSTTYTLGVEMVDAEGNRSGITTAMATTAADASGSYVARVLSLDPVAYWPLDDAPGSATIRDASGSGYGGVPKAGVVLGSAGIGDGRTAASFDGSMYQRITLPTGVLDGAFDRAAGAVIVWGRAGAGMAANDKLFTIGADADNWVNFQVSGAGRLESRLEFGNARDNENHDLSTNDPRGWHVYALVWDRGGANEVRHYLDGLLTETDSGVGDLAGAVSDEFTGIGGIGTNAYQNWKGEIAHVALFDRALTAAEVADLATVPESQASPNRAPVASFATSVDGLTATFVDASSDPDGDALTYTWNFGDGETSTLQNPIHTYTSAGTYTVILKVKDNNGARGTHTVRITTPVTQSILLQRGWQTISSFVVPDDPALKVVFENVASDVLLVEDHFGRKYTPRQGANDIGTWSPLQAYRVYASSNTTLTMKGKSALPPATPLSLKRGWNLVPYLPSKEMPAEVALGSILDNLILVKDNGNVYSPVYNVNRVGLLKPGRGYLIYVTKPCTLLYPSPAK